jgi:hypothetical protein
MIIQFQHNDKTCSAYVIPPSFSPANTIVVYMLDCNYDLGYHVIFALSEEKWKTNAGIKTKFPCTYQSLCKKLSEIFTPNVFEAVSLERVNDIRSKNKRSRRVFVS